MLRTAVKPRWLGLFAVVVVVMVSFTMLGFWQLSVARDHGRAEQAGSAPVSMPVADVERVLFTHAPFPPDGDGRRVTATGRYDWAGQVLVTPRVLRGVRGYWVVTPLVVRSSGARLAVVRGFVTDPEQAVAVTPQVAAEVTVSGSLTPGEAPAQNVSGSDAPLPDGQLTSLDLATLVNRWPGVIYNAFVFATAEVPDLTSTATPSVQRVPPPAASGGLSWRNTAYAFQWWAFALFAAYMWWKMVRDDYESGKATNVRAGSSDPR